MTGNNQTNAALILVCGDCGNEIDMLQEMYRNGATTDMDRNKSYFDSDSSEHVERYRFMLGSGGFTTIVCSNCKKEWIIEAGPSVRVNHEINENNLMGAKGFSLPRLESRHEYYREIGQIAHKTFQQTREDIWTEIARAVIEEHEQREDK